MTKSHNLAIKLEHIRLNLAYLFWPILIIHKSHPLYLLLSFMDLIMQAYFNLIV